MTYYYNYITNKLLFVMDKIEHVRLSNNKPTLIMVDLDTYEKLHHDKQVLYEPIIRTFEPFGANIIGYKMK